MNFRIKKYVVPLLLTPVLATIITLFFGGFILGLLQSVEFMPLIGLRDFSLEAYQKMITDDKFIGSLLLTLWLSIITTFLTIVFAIVTALALRQSFRWKHGVNFLYQFPLTIPHIVVAVGIMLLFSQSGFFARLFYQLGIISEQSEFPIIVFDDLGVGIILVYLWKQIPFIGLIVLAILQSVGNDFEELARSLGANKWQSFWYVLLPLIIPGIIPSSIICFAFVFGSFEVPYLLGKPYPAVLSVLAYRLYHDVDLNARPQAMAMAVFIAFSAGTLVVIYRQFMKRVTGRVD